MRHASRSLLLTVLWSMVLCLGASAAMAADLTLDISGVKSAEGDVLVAVYDAPANWLTKPIAVRKIAAATARGGRVAVRFTGLPAGKPLAISTFHDLNGNGKLDMDSFGMPTEPFAFSRQARAQFAPPTFEQAVLPVGTTKTAIALP